MTKIGADTLSIQIINKEHQALLDPIVKLSEIAIEEFPFLGDFDNIKIYFDIDMDRQSNNQKQPFSIVSSGLHNAIKVTFWGGHCFKCADNSHKAEDTHHTGVFLTNKKPNKTKDNASKIYGSIVLALVMSLFSPSKWYYEASNRYQPDIKTIIDATKLIKVVSRNKISPTAKLKALAKAENKLIDQIKSFKVSDNWEYPKPKGDNLRTKLICSVDCSTVVDGKLNISIASDWVDLLDGLTCPTCDGTFKEVLKTEKKPETKKKDTKKKKQISEVLANS